MIVYAIFGLTSPVQVKNNIEKSYADAHYDAGNGVFFVASDTETTKEVGEKLGFGNIQTVPRTTGIIVPVFNYWGRYDPNAWEWISAKQRAGR